MLTHPTAQALVEGVAAWLPLDGSASPFALRVARNALDIAARDMALGPAADERAGTIAPDDPQLVAHLAASALDHLAIDQPRYLHELDPNLTKR